MSAKAAKAGEGGKKKPPIMMILGAIILVVALFVGKGMMGGAKAESKEKGKKEKEKVEVGHSMPLDEFLVNLRGTGDHYLRVTIALGLKKSVTEEKAKEEVAPMRDAILTILSAKTLEELSKPKNREDLKEDIRAKINEAVEDEPVAKVYFTAFATQ